MKRPVPKSENIHSTSGFSSLASKRRVIGCRLWLWASAQQLFCTKLYKTISFHAAAGAGPSEARTGRPQPSPWPGHPRSKLATRLSAAQALSGHVRPGHAGQAGLA